MPRAPSVSQSQERLFIRTPKPSALIFVVVLTHLGLDILGIGESSGIEQVLADNFFGLRSIRPEVYRDVRGQLSVIELERLGLFATRAFFIDFHHVPVGTARAEHATSCAQLLVPLRGTFRLDLDNGERSLTLTGRASETAYLIAPGVWRRIANMDEDCLVMVLADQSYEGTTYFPHAMPDLIS